MVQRRCLPTGCETFSNSMMSFKTTAGSFTSAEFVYLTSVSLPEFSLTRKVKKVKAYLFDAPDVEYDLILGRNFLNQAKIDVLSSQLKCTWFDDSIPFHPANHFSNNEAVRSVLEVQPYRVDTQESYHVTAANRRVQIFIKSARRRTTWIQASKHNYSKSCAHMKNYLMVH